jgi:hypothetical protein
MNKNNKIFRNNIFQIIIIILSFIVILAFITLIYHKFFNNNSNNIPSYILQQINPQNTIKLIELKNYLDNIIKNNNFDKICSNINDYKFSDTTALSIFTADYPYKCVCSGFSEKWKDKNAQEINDMIYPDCYNAECDFYRLIVKLTSVCYREQNKCGGFYVTKQQFKPFLKPTPYIYYVQPIKVENNNAIIFIGLIL